MNHKTKNRLSFIINVVFVAVVVALVYLGFKYVIGWVLPFLLAFCIVSLVHPLVNVIKKRLRIKQEIVSLLVMVLIYAVIAVLLFLLVLQIIYLVQTGFTQLMPYYYSTIQPGLIGAGNSITAFVRDLPPQLQEQLTNIQGEVIQQLQSFLVDLSQKGLSLLSGLTGSVPSFLIAFVFTIMLSFFISMQYEKVVAFFKIQLSPRVKGIFSDLRTIIRETILKYLKATLTLMVVTFVELSIGLLVLRTGNAIPIALGIAVFDALPFFGTGAVVIPWVIVELLQGHYSFAVGLLILYAIVTLVRNIIEPKVVGDKLGLNPIVSLVSIYLGFKLFGVIGMIFMPIFTQITMELHKSGTIRLFKEEAPPQKQDQEPPAEEETAQ